MQWYICRCFIICICNVLVLKNNFKKEKRCSLNSSTHISTYFIYIFFIGFLFCCSYMYTMSKNDLASSAQMRLKGLCLSPSHSNNKYKTAYYKIHVMNTSMNYVCRTCTYVNVARTLRNITQVLSSRSVSRWRVYGSVYTHLNHKGISRLEKHLGLGTAHQSMLRRWSISCLSLPL